jgi:hypothetical protein
MKNNANNPNGQPALQNIKDGDHMFLLLRKLRRLLNSLEVYPLSLNISK